MARKSNKSERLKDKMSRREARLKKGTAMLMVICKRFKRWFITICSISKSNIAISEEHNDSEYSTYLVASSCILYLFLC